MSRVWAAPATALGLALASTFDKRFVHRGVVLAEGARWPRKVGWKYRAITLGHVVLCVDEIDPATMDHEMVHVRQFERWGPGMAIAYPAGSLWAVLKGGHAYRDNPFERAARGATPPGSERHAG